jgi:hypothetical protein
MAEIYFYSFILICLAILGWGMLRLERVYQYPFVMAAIFLSFIAPQANSLLNNESSRYISLAMLEKVLLYSCMCAAMCWYGYKRYQPKEQWLSMLDIFLDDRRLFHAGVVLFAIGYSCNFLLSVINIERTIYGTWTGPATILVFFGSLMSIAFPIFLLSTLKKPNFINMTMTVISAIPLLEIIILHGRRTPLMTFLLTVGMSFFLIKKYIPPRLFFLGIVIGAIVIIPVLGQLRGEFWSLLFSGDIQGVVDASQSGLVKIKKDDILELRNAALMIDAADLTNRYGYGTGFWDSIVFQYVPGQLVGIGFKQSLQFGTSINLNQIYGYRVPIGSTTTGLGDSYAEFGYFGCLVFAGMGRIFKTLWASIYRGSMFSALLYIGLISPAMLGITHGIGWFVQSIIFQVGVMSLVAMYARTKFRFGERYDHESVN